MANSQPAFKFSSNRVYVTTNEKCRMRCERTFMSKEKERIYTADLCNIPGKGSCWLCPRSATSREEATSNAASSYFELLGGDEGNFSSQQQYEDAASFHPLNLLPIISAVATADA